MVQAMIEELKEEHPCDFCKKICKSNAGLMALMNKMHPFDSPSSLTCYTCNRLFTNRDLIQNHYKTVRHQLECKKMRALEQVEKTNPEAEIKNYRKNLLKITHFKAPNYRPRRWENEETRTIPLESKEILEDPRRNIKRKTVLTEEPLEKMRKLPQEPEPTGCQNNLQDNKLTDNQENQEDPDPTTEGVILHITESELNLFPEANEEPTDSKLKEDWTTSPERRTVYLNNNWQVKDCIESPAFPGIIEEDPNIDWLTFISENINY